MNTIQPGTRCECRDPKCAGNVEIPGHSVYPDALKCDKPAVRLVTVRETNWRTNPVQHPLVIPMCEACAKHAESGGE